jgi:hypothetical protein
MRTIPTRGGDIRLLDLPPRIFCAIRALLPLGVAGLRSREDGADYGIVMKCGEVEAKAVKQQPPDTDERSGDLLFRSNACLVAHAIKAYLQFGFAGVLMPCAYRRAKPGGRVEAGIAYFGAASSNGREALEYPRQPRLDQHFGAGFTTMITGFMGTLSISAATNRLPMQKVFIGLEIRKRLELGVLCFGCLAIGPHLVCVKSNLNEHDPTWLMLRSAGVTELFHMPSVPLEIRADQLTIVKPEADFDRQDSAGDVTQ